MVVQISEVLCYLLCRLDIICITALLFPQLCAIIWFCHFKSMRVWQREQIFMNAYMYLAVLEN